MKLFLASLIVLSLEAKPPTDWTKQIYKEASATLAFNNKDDFVETEKGFIAPLPNNGIIRNEKGEVIWDLSLYSYLDPSSPNTAIHPSLWRQALLLSKAGLFKVKDSIYQVRGADLSNMTIIEGEEGIIVIDPLTTVETAKAAIELYYQNRGKKPVKAVIYTHSHADHFGGVKGVISKEDVDQKKVRVIAPLGFMEAVLDENVLTGNVMERRSSYMFGDFIAPGNEGQATAGLGISLPHGQVTLIPPTELVSKTGENLEIDGVKFSFLYAPNSEAPAELIFYLPELKALGIAEDANHTMHNLYTLRGAKVRDSKLWARYLSEVLKQFGNDTEVVFGQHHWPVWGNEKVKIFLEKQRDLYKYLHDQSLRLANMGYNMVEVGERIELPKELSQEWYNRGYYGSTNHNAKSVYNFYLGWFDGNPSTLHPLPSVEAGKKYVEYMGGEAAVLEKAKKDFEKGQYRFVAEVLNHLVFANPNSKEAKELLADTLEQLGYQSENAVWRNFYLSGALELRKGVEKVKVKAESNDVISSLPTEIFLDYLAVKLDGPRAAEHPLILNFSLPDVKEEYKIEIKNGVLHHESGKSEQAGVQFTLNRSDFNQVILKNTTFAELEKNGKLVIEGDRKVFGLFFSLLDSFDPFFNIVEPVGAQ